jgi:hypothetical protein
VHPDAAASACMRWCSANATSTPPAPPPTTTTWMALRAPRARSSSASTRATKLHAGACAGRTAEGGPADALRGMRRMHAPAGSASLRSLRRASGHLLVRKARSPSGSRGAEHACMSGSAPVDGLDWSHLGHSWHLGEVGCNANVHRQTVIPDCRALRETQVAAPDVDGVAGIMDEPCVGKARKLRQVDVALIMRVVASHVTR